MGIISIQKKAARQFVKDWIGKGYEKDETQRFWMALVLMSKKHLIST